ncbi:hypothetical protein BCR43DRAFT_488807 [Syncephalastrum racemosum]|uniref:Uncharacterized protein n=1 Tax=Syncephalastrum racemosum TaxID=13706 RepID=A0A1X2HJA0_SYNRA|nr:hypothetical protein BCR43DRAFT_488807 [Syncephalastrum racemosum]
MSSQPKSFKWSNTTASNANGRVKSGRVHKRTSSSSSASTVSSSRSRHINKKPMTPQEEIKRLESEIIFTYDTVATITVMFDSLQNAYATCKPEIDRNYSETRLSAMEKELLASYDDLGLQVTHLERQIVKLEKRLIELRQQEAAKNANKKSPPSSPPSSPDITNSQATAPPAYTAVPAMTPPVVAADCPLLKSEDDGYLSSPESSAALDMESFSQPACFFQAPQQPLAYYEQPPMDMQAPYALTDFFLPTQPTACAPLQPELYLQFDFDTNSIYYQETLQYPSWPAMDF